jgi:valyl-tRNA synthetase
VIPFVTEELRLALAPDGGWTAVAPWPAADESYVDSAAMAEIALLQRVVTEVRRFRADQGVKPGQRVAARLSGLTEAGSRAGGGRARGSRAGGGRARGSRAGGGRVGGGDGARAGGGLAAHEPLIRALARLDEPAEDFAATATLAVAGGVSVALDTRGVIDVAAERARLEKDRAAAEKEAAQCRAKLDNPAFVGKAPEQVVAKIRDRLAAAEADLARINGQLDALPA